MKGTGVLIFFFGQRNYSLVPVEAIVPFQDFMEKKQANKKKSKNKSLKRAIKEAVAVQKNELTIDESLYLAEEEEKKPTEEEKV